MSIDRERPKHFLIVGVLLALGAFLRLYQLGYTYLWIDEITVFMFGDPKRSLMDIISEIYRAKFAGFTGQHMPMQYLLANLAQHFQSYAGHPGEHFIVRLPFALLGIASLPFVYMVASRVFDRITGYIALFLAATSFFHVYMSRDATSYAPLLFFLVLHLWSIVAFLETGLTKNKRVLLGLLVLLSAAGALFTHMTAWIFLGTEGLLFGASGVWNAWWNRGNRSFLASLFAQPGIRCGLLMLVASLPLWPLVIGGLHQFTATTDANAPNAAEVSMPLLVYQMAFFGWGRSGGRLTAFSLAVLFGVLFSLRSGKTRAIGLFLVMMVILQVLLFSQVLSRDFAPRYLTIIFYPLLGLAAIGISGLASLVARPAFPGFVRPALLVAIVASVCAWHVRPYLVLLNAGDKMYAIRPVHQWLLNNTPPGGLYVFRNSFFMREVPSTFPVPGRYTAVSEHNQQLEYFSANTRSYFERFPLAVLLVMPDSPYEASGWPWIHSDFSRSNACGGVEYQHELWKYGFWAGGLDKPKAVEWVAYWNTEEDVLQRARNAGKDFCIIPQFGGWGFGQSQDMKLFAAPSERAVVRVYNLGSEPVNAEILVTGIAQSAGRVSVRSSGGDKPLRFDLSYQPGQFSKASMGRHLLRPGPNDIEISSSNPARQDLLVYSFDVTR